MSKIDRCVWLEVLPPFAIALLLMTFLVFAREFGRIVDLLIRKSVPPSTVLGLCASLLPGILIFTLPMALMVGVLVGFSRMSTESEVVAFVGNGISVARLLRPVVTIAAGVAAVTLVMSTLLLPIGNVYRRWVKHELALRPAASEIKSRVFHEDFGDLVLYVDDISLEKGSWRGVFLSDMSNPQEHRIVLSRRGRVLASPAGDTLQLHFEDGTLYKVNRELPEKDNLSRFQFLDHPIRLTEENQPELSLVTKDKTMRQLWQDRNASDAHIRVPARSEFQKRFALPLSALIFGILGVAMGVKTHRGGRSYGFVVSIVAVFTYFTLTETGTGLANHQDVPVPVGIWGPNLIFLAVALLLLRRVHRESHLANFLMDNPVLRGALTRARRVSAWVARLPKRLAEKSRSDRASSIRWRFARVVDLYLARDFISHLGLTTLAVLTLFLVFTLFELVDDVIKNNIAIGLVIEYFIYLIPHILYTVIPFCILLGVLITFALLDKTNQITAFKATGMSLYRLVVPILTLTVFVCGLMFLMQEYVLPAANQRQDYLRSVIRGRPVQTYYNPEKKWIFGQNGSLYNYDYYDVQHRVFAELSVYRLDIRQSRLSERIYAKRANWDATTNAWTLLDGWVRNFESPGNEYTRFDRLQRTDLEAPEYFIKEVKDSNKMTYPELKSYIQSLAQGGFEVDHLLVELHKKISFPFVSLIMALIGIPFAFSMGKHGTLYGIAISILAGVIFWGTFGVFDVLGTAGFMEPFLAAWAPNILYGAAGLYLFLTIRT